ncbi:MAG: phosphotransferase family protein, partial [Acidimicrobiales bacterium]
MVTIAGQARPVDLGQGELVGSHRDLNAHNVIFSPSGLRLIDWESAGPAWPRWERSTFAVLWGSADDGSDDVAVSAFLRGYLDGGGVLDREDPSVLAAAPAALLPWVLTNLELALARPSPRQSELAT